MTLFWLITAYAIGCDAKPGHPTRSGVQPTVGFTIAADPAVLPLGSIIYVEGLGERMVQDIGGKVKGRHLDVFMGDCRTARRWGRQHREVTLLHRGGE